MSKPSETYEDVGLDQLLVYAAACIEARGDDLTFELLVAECYFQFPKRFHLKGYPQWPDSAKVNKSWLRCRADKGWMAGSPRRGLRLTDAGREEASRTERRLLGTSTAVPELDSERVHRTIDGIRQSSAFEAFHAGEAVITEEALVSSIGAPPEASRVRLREQLRFAQQCANAAEDQEVTGFLRLVEASLKHRLKRPWKRGEGSGHP